jgi:hypothetical protein
MEDVHEGSMAMERAVGLDASKLEKLGKVRALKNINE